MISPSFSVSPAKGVGPGQIASPPFLLKSMSSVDIIPQFLFVWEGLLSPIFENFFFFFAHMFLIAGLFLSAL